MCHLVHWQLEWVVPSICKQWGCHESGTDVGDADVFQPFDMAELTQAFEVMADKPL